MCRSTLASSAGCSCRAASHLKRHRYHTSLVLWLPLVHCLSRMPGITPGGDTPGGDTARHRQMASQVVLRCLAASYRWSRCILSQTDKGAAPNYGGVECQTDKQHVPGYCVAAEPRVCPPRPPRPPLPLPLGLETLRLLGGGTLCCGFGRKFGLFATTAP